jgi:hypothetical protein
MAADLFKETP